MSIQALTGADVIKIDSRILTDLIDGDTVILEFGNDIGALKTGKNGNSIFAFNATGLNAKVTIRLVMGSSDDKFMQSRLAEWLLDASSFSLITGEFIKNTGDGAGTVAKNKYILSGGIFTKIPSAKTNVDGDTEQSVSVYNLSFANAIRSIA